MGMWSLTNRRDGPVAARHGAGNQIDAKRRTDWNVRCEWKARGNSRALTLGDCSGSVRVVGHARVGVRVVRRVVEVIVFGELSGWRGTEHLHESSDQEHRGCDYAVGEE